MKLKGYARDHLYQKLSSYNDLEWDKTLHLHELQRNRGESQFTWASHLNFTP